MRIEGIIWLDEIIDKLSYKHNVRIEEVEEVLESDVRIRFVEKGKRPGENIYVALGKTDAGRFLAVLFIYKPKTHEALILSGRDMAPKERKLYAKTKN